MERLRAVEEVLKSPENEPIQNGVNLIMDVYKGGNPKRKSKEGGNSLDSIIESQIERAQKVNTLILSIRKYIFKSDMKEESKEGFFLDVNFYIFQKLWPLIEKGCEDILKMDKKFAEHLSDLKMFITTKFLGFPDTMNNDTLTGHSLFQGTIRALKFLELPNSPYDKLQIIYGIYKNCNRKYPKEKENLNDSTFFY